MRCQILTLVCLYGVCLSLVRADFVSSCPAPCSCRWSGGLRRADCSNAEFTTIPNFHDAGNEHVQVLIMDGNYIKELPKNIFHNAGLEHVKKIHLRNCQIEKIHRDAFSRLGVLTEINLEGNQISKLDVKSFDGNINLETLVLSRNKIPILREYQFPPLKSLKKIYIANSGLEEVSNKAFNNLVNVEEIDFSGNKLKVLEDTTFVQLKHLKTLNLKDNKWVCDCGLKSFRDFTVHRNLNTGVPKCHEPERLGNKSWDRTSSLEFACKPDIKVQSERVYAESGWNVTLSCHITGNPVPSMRWVLNGRVLHGNSTRVSKPGHQYQVQDVALGPGGIERNFSLVINSVEWDDQGDYNCVAINQGGMAEKNITLTFSHPTTWADMSDPSSLPFILATVGSFVLFILIVIIFCCVCRKHGKDKKKKLSQNDNLMSSFSDPAGEKLLPNQTARFEDGDLTSVSNSADSYMTAAAYPDLISNRMTALNGEGFYSGGHVTSPVGQHMTSLPPLPPQPHHMHHSQELLNPVHFIPVHRMHPNHMNAHDSPFQRTATLPHNYTIGTLPHHPRSVSYDHSAGGGPPARPGYVTLPRRPRTSVPGYGAGSGRDAAPSPAFSYGGVAEHRDPIYDGVGPRTSADGSSKLSLNHSQGDGTPRGHNSTGSRPPGSISYALPPPIDEAPEIRPKQKQEIPLSTATSQQTLLDGLEENLAAYDEPWGAAMPPPAPPSQGEDGTNSNSTIEETTKLNQDFKRQEDPVMCSTPKSSFVEQSPPTSTSKPSVVPPKTKPKTWKKPSLPANVELNSSQQPLLGNNQDSLSVCTSFPDQQQPNQHQLLLSPATSSVASQLSSADHSPRGRVSADHSPRGGISAEHSPRSPLSDNLPAPAAASGPWSHQRKVGKVRPQPPPKPKLSLNSGNAQKVAENVSSASNSFQDETNDGSEV